MKHAKNTGFSIVLAMGIVLLLSMIGLYLMEYMIPFSRSVKGIENASQAFYESYGGIEESVLKAYSGTVGSSYNKVFSVAQDYEYSFVGSGDEIPAPGQGNAPDNPNYSRLSQNEPISILVGGKNYDNPGASISINFRIPNSVGFSSSLEDEIILLQLSGDGGSISSASGALITKSDVTGGAFNLLLENGVSLVGIEETFRYFYGPSGLGCDSAVINECVLKISIIRPLISDSGDAIIPYLEYQINSSEIIPYPNPIVSSQGRSYGFSKTLEVFIPQQATSSAFDFTVLQ